MSMSRPVSGLTIALVTLPLFPLVAAAQLAVSANDGKVVLVNGVVTVPANPLDDTVTIINIGVSPPKVIAEIKAPSSVVGPPQNVAVAPDESLALVASTMKLYPAYSFLANRNRGPAVSLSRPTGRPPSSRVTAITAFPFCR